MPNEPNVVGKITELLKDMLCSKIREHFPDIASDSILLEFPKKEKTDTKTGIAIVLYKVSMNAYLRNNQTETPGHIFPPLAFDLHYALVPYSPQHHQQQELLGYAMQILGENTVLPQDKLEGDVVKISMEDMEIQDMNALWRTIAGEGFKPFLCYQVSPVRIHTTKTTAVAKVKEARAEIEKMPGKGKQEEISVKKLFNLPIRYQETLNRRIISDDLQKEFAQKGYGLEKGWTLQIVEERWSIEDKEGNKHYWIAKAKDSSGNDTLEVYGKSKTIW